MGKKKVKDGLGKSIIRDRFGGKPRHAGTTTHLHTSELNDGYDWNRINLRSVTEETSMDEFLATAQLAGTEFIAERMNIKFVSEESRAGLVSAEDQKKIQELHQEHRQLLRIPRRPKWDENTSAQELDLMERESFLEWRRQLASIQDVEGLVMTPFERNLDFWRQLWRVTERSDLVVQIVDARNPLLFRSKDLEQYVKEVDPSKINMLLINKADFLTQQQREMWASHFDQEQIKVAFWSAVLENERLKEEAEDVDGTSEDFSGDEDSSEDEDLSDDVEDLENDEEPPKSCEDCSETDTGNQNTVSGDVPLDTDKATENPFLKSESDVNLGTNQRRVSTNDVADPSSSVDMKSASGSSKSRDEHSVQPTDVSPTGTDHTSKTTETCPTCPNEDENTRDSDLIKNSPDILSGSELIKLFQSLHRGKKYMENTTTVGLVGYPNVGKSSTINALLQMKKVPVSATPGRTKHFQTLFLDKTLMLCDCPGLVMPSFVNTKSEMVLNGILPIDQMRDYVPPVALLASLIPRRTLEAIYGIMIPKPREGEDENRPPTAHELLAAYGYMRGFMTHKGIPDFQRSSRHVLKDFVTGKLLYCNSPPGCDVDEFCPTPTQVHATKERAHPQPAPIGSRSKNQTFDNELDQMFFEKVTAGSGTKGVAAQRGGPSGSGGTPSSSQQSLAGKPWKKHNNRGKKQKLRRIHSYLDA